MERLTHTQEKHHKTLQKQNSGPLTFLPLVAEVGNKQDCQELVPLLISMLVEMLDISDIFLCSIRPIQNSASWINSIHSLTKEWLNIPRA